MGDEEYPDESANQGGQGPGPELVDEVHFEEQAQAADQAGEQGDPRQQPGGRIQREVDSQPPAVFFLMGHKYVWRREEQHQVHEQPVGQVIPGVRQERFQVKESQHGGQQGKKRDDHHIDAHPGPLGLEGTEADQEQGVAVHHPHQAGIDLGLDGPDEEDLGHGGQTHQDDEGRQSVGEQRQKDKLHPFRKIVEPPLFNPVHITSNNSITHNDQDTVWL